MFKYFTEPGEKITYVDFRILDSGKKEIIDLGRTSCFAHVTYGGLPKEYSYLEYKFLPTQTPYSEEFIIRYTKLMNELGFPFEYLGNYSFLVEFAKFQDKRIMLTSTLTIIRYLQENGLFYIPELMYYLIEQESEDPFVALQKAHNISIFEKFKIKKLVYDVYGNTNNSLLIFKERGKFYTKEEFFNKVKENNAQLYINSYVSCNLFWEK